MSTPGLEKLKSLLEKATGLPWTADLGETYKVRDPLGGAVASISFLGHGGKFGGKRPDPEPGTNAALIAEGISALPALIARVIELESLLERALPCVKAVNGGEHLMDGFKPQERSTDKLLADIRAALNQGEAK